MNRYQLCLHDEDNLLGFWVELRSIDAGGTPGGNIDGGEIYSLVSMDSYEVPVYGVDAFHRRSRVTGPSPSPELHPV